MIAKVRQRCVRYVCDVCEVISEYRYRILLKNLNQFYPAWVTLGLSMRRR